MRAFKQHHSTVYKFTERKRLRGRNWHNSVQCRLSINGLHGFSIVLLTGSCFSYWQRSSNRVKDQLNNLIQIIMNEVQYLYQTKIQNLKPLQ